ncbi:hypothetical protein DEO72_LG7g445 [Vigna unguiculata]|uniref:Uncharacterized protein n=1 Tax=Vigna unguiculata TaxID=3917 RepID=A0A4D6MEF6_VIGUN|nr:hypothetical protein DEO72_LG7g444 [Vigna unguiculata]QCD99164.1 hypothetical protein DEO72_LG7g445 [Vigna unguiculata]
MILPLQIKKTSDEANESVDSQQQLLVLGACAEVVDAMQIWTHTIFGEGEKLLQVMKHADILKMVVDLFNAARGGSGTIRWCSIW